MNLEALNKRYPDGIPEDLQKGVSLFRALSEKGGVKSVHLMSNFGLDLERSLTSKTNIYKGVIIQVSPNYKLSEEDRSWFHPELTKARSLYRGKFDKDANLGEYNSSVGTYSTYSVDELGGQKLTHFTIVDTAVPKTVSTTVNHWFASRSDIKSVYTDYKTNKVDGNTLQRASQNTRDSMGQGEALLTSEYVSLYKDANSYHFYNHVIKSSML